MLKKIVTLTLACGLIISSGAFASADTNIVNSMDFQGTKVTLTLDQAIEKAKKDSLAGKTAEWNKETAYAAYLKNMSTAIEVRDARELPIVSIEIPSAKDGEMAALAGEFAKSMQDKNYTAEQNALRAQVIESYFKIINLNDLVNINKDNVAVRDKLYSNINKKFQLGMVAKQDVLNAQYELASARNTYDESVVTLKNAKMNFNLFLGYDVMQDVQLTDTISENAKAEDISIADAVSKALVNRNEIYATKFNQDLQTLGMDKISIRYPASSSTYIDQDIALKKAKENYQLANKSVEIDVRSKYLDVNQKKNEIETDKKALETATEALRLTQLSYDAGMAIITDVQTAQTRVFQAKLALSNAILEYNLAADAFSESLGNGRYVVSLSSTSE